jgi:hypothetical protein
MPHGWHAFFHLAVFNFICLFVPYRISVIIYLFIWNRNGFVEGFQTKNPLRSVVNCIGETYYKHVGFITSLPQLCARNRSIILLHIPLQPFVDVAIGIACLIFPSKNILYCFVFYSYSAFLPIRLIVESAGLLMIFYFIMYVFIRFADRLIACSDGIILLLCFLNPAHANFCLSYPCVIVFT